MDTAVTLPGPIAISSSKTAIQVMRARHAETAPCQPVVI